MAGMIRRMAKKKLRKKKGTLQATIHFRGPVVPPPLPPKPSPTVDPERIVARLRHVDLPTFLESLRDAIGEAKGMAGAMSPEDCDRYRTELDGLRDTLDFIFEGT